MTLDEVIAREAIRETAARYTRAVDNRRYDELRDVFLPDACVSVHGGPRLDGIHAIIAAFRAGAEKRGAGVEGNFQRHNLTSSIIDMTGPDRAKAAHYVLVVTELGFDHSGLYQDVYLKRGGSWLISERSARMAWVRQDSRFAAWLGAASPASNF